MDMTEDEYRSQLSAFLEKKSDLARSVIRAGMSEGEPADYTHIRIEVAYISTGVPFYVFHVTSATAEFEAAPRPELDGSEFRLPEHLIPDLWEEEPKERYRIASEAILSWIERAFSGIETHKPCYAAESGNYKIFDLRKKQWVEMDTWH